MSDTESDQAGVPLIEEYSESPSSKPNSSSKRKREGEEDGGRKRAKTRNKTKKPKDVQDDALDLDAGINHNIAHMDSKLLADHVAQRTKRFQPDLSSVEAEDLHIPEVAIRDSSNWQSGRTVEKLPVFLDKYSAPRRKKKKGPRLSDAAGENGSPHTIVVAASGIRAADLTRTLRHFQTKDAMVAKLFAKHIKLQDAAETVRKTRMNIGVGTPQRIADLIDNGAMSVGKLERIVVDASHIDQKKRGILDIKEIQVQLIQLLGRADLKARYGLEDDTRIELVFF